MPWLDLRWFCVVILISLQSKDFDMRIALIASSLRLAGAEKQFVYMARALQQAGIDVRVFYLGAGNHYQSVLVRMGVPLRQIFKAGQPLIMLARLVKEVFAFKPDIV